MVRNPSQQTENHLSQFISPPWAINTLLAFCFTFPVSVPLQVCPVKSETKVYRRQAKKNAKDKREQ